MKFIKKIINSIKCKHGFHEGILIEVHGNEYAICMHCKKSYVYVNRQTVALSDVSVNHITEEYLKDVNSLVDDPFKLSIEDTTMIDICAPKWKEYCKMYLL